MKIRLTKRLTPTHTNRRTRKKKCIAVQKIKIPLTIQKRSSIFRVSSNRQKKNYVCVWNSYTSKNHSVQHKRNETGNLNFIRTIWLTHTDTLDPIPLIIIGTVLMLFKEMDKKLVVCILGARTNETKLQHEQPKKTYPRCVIQRSFNFDLISLFDLFYEWALGRRDWPGCS